MSEVSAGQWIAVSTDPAKMPRPGQECSVLRRTLTNPVDQEKALMNGCVLAYQGITKEGDIFWWGKRGYEYGTVSHWQPLPPPPSDATQGAGGRHEEGKG